jgi:ADP-heptose:LPS heptosyltransferase
MPSATRTYGFVKPSLIRLFSLVDGLGSALITPFKHRGAWNEPQRILLVNLAHIGDVLLTTPAIAAVRARFPQAHMAMLVAPWSREVIAHNPRLNEVMMHRASWWDRSRGSPYLVPREFFSLVRELRQKKFDWVINFKSFFQENLAFALAGIPRRVGYGLYGGGFLQTDCLPFAWQQHVVLQHLTLTDAVGAHASNPKLEMFVSHDDERSAESWLSQISVSRWIAMHVGAGYPSKLWPIERYAQLANVLAEKYDAAIVLVGGKDDLPLIAQMQTTLRAPHAVVAGQASISQTAAVIQHCAIFVGNDSGPAHLAAAMKVPTVTLFSGENDAALWRPYGERVTALQHKPVCWLCGLRVCNRDHVCMTEISVEQVMNAITYYLG